MGPYVPYEASITGAEIEEGRPTNAMLGFASTIRDRAGGGGLASVTLFQLAEPLGQTTGNLREAPCKAMCHNQNIHVVVAWEHPESETGERHRSGAW